MSPKPSKPKGMNKKAATDLVIAETPKRRGRPPGKKNETIASLNEGFIGVPVGVKQKDSVTLTAVLNAVEGKFGKGSIMKAAATEGEQADRIPFNHPELDRITGGGIPRGRLTILVGSTGGGKSTATYEVIAQAQQLGLRCALIETEGAFDADYARCIGINVDDLLFSQPQCAEEAMEIVEMLVKSGEIGLIVIDSVAAMPTKIQLTQGMDENTVADKARLMSKALPKIVMPAQRTNTAVVFVNQWRNGIGYNAGKTMPGGEALKFASSLTVDFARKETLKNNKTGEPYGQISVIKVLKTRVGPPFTKCEIEYKFARYDGNDIISGSGGFNRMSAIVDAALDNGKLKQKGAWFEMNGKNIAQGREKLIAMMEADKELAERLK
jgi:recombination protein RecA